MWYNSQCCTQLIYTELHTEGGITVSVYLAEFVYLVMLVL